MVNTMKLSEEQTKKIGLLADIILTDKQVKDLSESISSVVGHMEEIKDLDLDTVPETPRATEEKNVYRSDTIESSLTQEEALSNAKKSYNGYFVVPYVFEEKK